MAAVSSSDRPGVGAAGCDRLGVDARPRSRVEARQHPAVARRIEQRQREALVAARLLERVVADETDPLERLSLASLRGRRGPGGQLVELARDCVHLVEMRVEDGLEALAVPAAGQTAQPGIDPAGPSGERDDGQEEQDDDDDEPDDERSEIGLDERVEVDPRILRWGRAESSRAPSPRPYPGGSAILCRRQDPGSAASRDPTDPSDGGPPQTMAKRVRGSTSRPGQRPPLQRQAARPAARTSPRRSPRPSPSPERPDRRR